jgi:hypothetical protein
MGRWRFLTILVLAIGPRALPAAEPAVGVVSGLVGKATPSVLIVYPRDTEGRFAHTVVIKIRKTSAVTVVRTYDRSGQQVFVQTVIPPNNLQPGQRVAAIFAMMPNEIVLISAVASAGR